MWNGSEAYAPWKYYSSNPLLFAIQSSPFKFNPMNPYLPQTSIIYCVLPYSNQSISSSVIYATATNISPAQANPTQIQFDIIPDSHSQPAFHQKLRKGKDRLRLSPHHPNVISNSWLIHNAVTPAGQTTEPSAQSPFHFVQPNQLISAMIAFTHDWPTENGGE